MPDPIDELDAFDPGELPVSPLPAAEVRRRGDRLRRRRQILATTAAAVVVAAIVVPLAAFTGGADRDPAPIATPSPTPTRGSAQPSPSPTTDWIQKIPAGFPLVAGLPGELRSDASSFPTGACTSSSTAPVVDMQSFASSPDTEGGYTRSLALFVNEELAASILDGLRGDLVACTKDPQSSIRQVVTTPVGDHLGWVALERDSAGQLDGQGEIFELFRVGNAVLVLGSTVSGAGDPGVVHQQASRTADDASEPLSMMCTFSQDGCPTSPGPTSVPATSSDDIPAAFDLQTTLQADVGDGGEQHGPSETAVGVFFADAFCGASAWPPAAVRDRLALSVTGPEYFEGRELLTFDGAAHAVEALAALRTATAPCLDGRPRTGSGDPEVFTELTGAQTGYQDSLTFAMTYQAGLGGDVYQFVRVGRAILATDASGEYDLDSARAAVPDLTTRNRAVTDQMCVFTDAGC